MNVLHADYARLTYFSHTDTAYIRHDPALREFYVHEPVRESIPAAIEDRKKNVPDRNLLLRVLKKQYKELNIDFPLSEVILLDENTFTITTAHQPTLFTGPLFHIYKIASVLHLCRDLDSSVTGYRFIPFFILNAEDHDWAEVNHVFLFGRKYEWERQTSGPCGRLSTEGLEALIKTIVELFPNAIHADEIRNILIDSLQSASNYSQFHRLILHRLFSRHGLIILDMDDVELKSAFIPVMEKEIREQFSFRQVTSTQSALERKGFKPQAFCRKVNLFYMDTNLRERIEPSEKGFQRIETKINYSLEEILAELNNHPERFSPNVILRPLYEEYILPNIAYVGGGGEIAYWLERKSQFEEAEIPFPMLIRRNSILLIDGSTSASIRKLELKSEDFLAGYDSIARLYLHKHSQVELSYEEEMKWIHQAYKQLAKKAEQIDLTLSKAILAEEAKQSKQFEQLCSRLLRSEKQQQETLLKKIQRIREKLFPEGGLQERHDNFMPFYARYGADFIDKIVSVSDPFVSTFTILELEDPQASEA